MKATVIIRLISYKIILLYRKVVIYSEKCFLRPIFSEAARRSLKGMQSLVGQVLESPDAKIANTRCFSLTSRSATVQEPFQSERNSMLHFPA